MSKGEQQLFTPQDDEAVRLARFILRSHQSGDRYESDAMLTIARALITRSESAAIKDDIPLRCEVVDGAIQFVIGTKVLAHATNICPTLYDAEKDRGRYRVTDHAVFAKAVAHELNHEDEAGNTPLTRMLDEAVDDAINQGAEGVEENT